MAVEKLLNYSGLEKYNDLIHEELDKKANIDGFYENLGAGYADQLLSSVYTEDSVPYNFRTSGGSIDIGNRKNLNEIVGVSVAWNQLVQDGNFTDASKWVKQNNNFTFSVSNNIGTITIPDNTLGGRPNISPKTIRRPIAGHKYFLNLDIIANTAQSVESSLRFEYGWDMYLYSNSTFVNNTWLKTRKIFECPTNITERSGMLYVAAQLSSWSNNDTIQYKDFMLIDLTAEFNPTIADYVYSLEQATAGAGVAWLKQNFPKMFEGYQPYNEGEIVSVSGLSSIDNVGFNAWDEEWELGYYNVTTGEPATSSQNLRSKNFIPVIPNTSYYAKVPTGYIAICEYDADKNFIKCKQGIANSGITTTADTHFIRFHCTSAYGNTYKNDICINFSWDGERDGEYEPYVKHRYPLDSSLTLRGILKLDENNKLYADGDVYPPSGGVGRRHAMVDLGTLNWSYDSTNEFFYTSGISSLAKRPTSVTSREYNIIAEGYTIALNSTGEPIRYAEGDSTWANIATKSIALHLSSLSPSINMYIYVKNTDYTDAAAFKTAMSGVMLQYELAEPTTENADPYQQTQIVDDFGTEEFVSTSIVPVGHTTQYMVNLKAKAEMSPNSPSGAGDYIVRQTNGQNEYVSLASNATIQDMLARIEALENPESEG